MPRPLADVLGKMADSSDAELRERKIEEKPSSTESVASSSAGTERPKDSSDDAASKRPTSAGLIETLLPFIGKMSDRWRNWWVRGVFGVSMILGFVVILYLGKPALAIFVLLLEVKSFDEILTIGHKKYREYYGLPWYRVLNWLFYATANYYFLGENLANYYSDLIASSSILIFLFRYHRFISMMMYISGIVLFVLTLQKGLYRVQFSLFAWTHISLLVVSTQVFLVIQNILDGVYWFVLPVSMVICNDVMAYFFGFFFGRTSLIKLSPKKTWEGFIGALFSTLIFGVFMSWFLAQFNIFICDVPGPDCEYSPLLQASPYTFSLLGWTTVEVWLYPIMVHSLALATFASLIAPFGGFFASGFKRAFDIKDFSDVIPGHGGVLDRFDCQFLMNSFANIYFNTFCRGPSVHQVWRSVLLLATEHQLSLHLRLQDSLVQRRAAMLPLLISSKLLSRLLKRSFSAAIYPLQLQHQSKDHAAIYEESIRNPERFWGELAKTRLKWTREFDVVKDCNFREGKIKWFEGGLLNVSENTLDRHVATYGDQLALIWEKDEPGDNEFVTYRELLARTCQLANLLKSEGVRKGDRVVIYMPTSPLAVTAMLACARIGAVHSVVFAGFSAEALRDRIADSRAEVVVTADQAVRGGRQHNLKEIVDAAVAPLPAVRRVLVMRRTGEDVPMGTRDRSLEEGMSSQSQQCPPEPLRSEDPLFILYTSGSTGKPKGLVHTQAGYLLYAGLTHQLVFDYRPGQRYCCVADIGWITGHSYVVYGPLSNAATTVLFESSPEHPDPGRYWEMVQRLRLSQLYTSPTAVRALHRHSDRFVTQYDRSSLKMFGCVGEPLNAEAWEWLHSVAGEGRCPIADTWWQTETGGIMITPLPGSDVAQPKPGFPQTPFFGVDPVITAAEDGGEELLGNDVEGRLCVRSATPGMARTIYGDHQRFLSTYFGPHPGLYCSGDGARRDGQGHYQITGRVDDVINVKGHRIGTAEVESALDDDERVSETAVVGYPHEVFGQGIAAYVILCDGVADQVSDIQADLEGLVRKKIGSFAVPQKILFVPGLPKTRSGKIMRRVLRQVAQGAEEFGDLSTLANPEIVQDLRGK